MKKWIRFICLIMTFVIMLSLFGCGKKTHKKEKPVNITPYLGTWQGNDHTGEDVVHYLIFDSNGYWNIYMNYDTLLRAIKQLPDQLVSFKVFCDVQKSEHTGCYYEYIVGVDYVNDYYVNEEGRLCSTSADEVIFTKLYDDVGEPNATVVSEARDLFDRALMEAHKK